MGHQQMACKEGPLRLAVGLTLMAVVAACGVSLPVRPAAPMIDTIGVLSGINASTDRTTYTLADGRVWDRPNDQFRVAYDMPAAQTLFVAGADQDGTYVLLVGGQEGLPEDCPYALRYGGLDWGDAVESQGLLWPKAAGFTGIPDQPDVGADYPGNAGFCLDDHGRVTSVYLAEPGLGAPVPAGSAAAP